MNLLFITPVVPTQTDGRRPYNFIKYLTRRHQVHLIAMRMPVQSDADVEHLRSMGVHIHSIIDYPPWRSTLQCLTGLFLGRSLRVSWCKTNVVAKAIQNILDETPIDLVHIDRMRMGQYARFIDKPVVIDFTDSLPLYLRRALQYRKRWTSWMIDRWELATIPNEEKRLHRISQRGLVCSELDAEEYRKTDATAKMTVIRNAVDIDQFVPQQHAESHTPRLILSGTLFYFPNIDSVRYYVDDILPLIRERFPHMETFIIGTRPAEWIRQLNGYQGIRVLPDVPRMEEQLFQDDIYLCPLRVAAGVRNKLLEAMACRMPVISTELGAEGLGAEAGQEFLVAETPEDFVNLIEHILNTPDLADRLGHAGRTFVKQNHMIDELGRQLVSLYEELIQK